MSIFTIQGAHMPTGRHSLPHHHNTVNIAKISSRNRNCTQADIIAGAICVEVQSPTHTAWQLHTRLRHFRHCVYTWIGNCVESSVLPALQLAEEPPAPECAGHVSLLRLGQGFQAHLALRMTGNPEEACMRIIYVRCLYAV